MVVHLGAPSFSAAGWIVQGCGGVSAPDAQDGNSCSWAEDFQQFSGLIPPTPGDPAHGRSWKKTPLMCYISCWIHRVIEQLLTTLNVSLLQVSERAGHIIQYDKFYIHELDELIDIRNDYVTWIQRQIYQSVSPLMIVSFTIPFVPFVYVVSVSFSCLFCCLCFCDFRVMMDWWLCAGIPSYLMPKQRRHCFRLMPSFRCR